ncbi:tRNA modification GTPase [Salinibacter ruber]|uniref:tRNA uridine-5-carboxymethylaminomethyl(34) synthesis GTPase MnmE n=1 Tax=Salinibacter ruber TaxID=146919 RepID=UPI0021677D1B|nr:tRNA uridine-5-carboxymethylaminomethyl(34) synthesis GTPase MnmE [Salinibacter ruber]MCS3649927.1 tRNA modification GTPase [Salinibacter ruber]MCS3653181.1 tRNA modification GTPase [Salinibacter ruber]
MSQSDTIAAIATARGRAALAVVRTSGPAAIEIVDRCFRGDALTDADSHTAHVGVLTDEAGTDIDQVVATVFRAPNSATGEHVVEVSCHGGDLAPKMALQSLLDHGARMAEPGEFTERAFLNGKMDLAQAEAVADLIDATSTKAHQASLTHLKGRYSDLLGDLREELLNLCSLVELEIDFSDEDVEFADRERLEDLLDETEEILGDLLDTYSTGEKLKDGVQVVIGGRPNAGKSTLLNALVGHDRAIVSETPGTTRDEIEAEAEIEGVLFRFVDTAGLRDTADEIEAEGVRRATESIEEADVLFYLYDLTVGLDSQEIAFLQDLADDGSDVQPVVIGNKADRAPDLPVATLDGLTSLKLSALEAREDADEVQPLLDHLTDTVAEHLSRAEASPVVMNQRHRQHLRDALDAVQQAREALDAGVSGDMLTLDLRAALQELGAITGEITNEDVLDQIFSRFCIGK